jgi:23S rRNA (adenine-N6)-dimethyltransferase
VDRRRRTEQGARRNTPAPLTGSASRRTARHDRDTGVAGQVFLADDAVIAQLLVDADVSADDVVVDLGAGGGALTLPLAETGARVIAVEVDTVWVARLRERVRRAGVAGRVRVIHADLRRFRPPRGRWRVVADPPFAHTTTLLRRLLDDPVRGPERADLVLQADVARKRARTPPTTLLGASWAPWWQLELGRRIPRRAFRPVPRVDAAVLTITRRDPPILPAWLTPGFADVLRPAWRPPPPSHDHRS